MSRSTDAPIRRGPQPPKAADDRTDNPNQRNQPANGATLNLRPRRAAPHAKQPSAFACLRTRFDRIPFEWLEPMALDVASSPGFRENQMDSTFLAFAVSTEILRFFFGNKWTNENVFACHPEVSPQNREGREFLKTEFFTDPVLGLRYMRYVTEIAECLYNLQDTPGIKIRIELMKSDNLESALGELQVAKLFAHPSFRLRFIKPTGIAGSDYDLEFTTSENRVICGEIKTKKEKTAFGQRTISNTLEAARKQLPKDAPGMIFLNLPETWPTISEFQQITEASILKVFRQSDRVVAIVPSWDNWTPYGRNVVYRRGVWSVYNQRSTKYARDIAEVFELSGRLKNPSWLSFWEYFSSRFQDFIAKVQWRVAERIADHLADRLSNESESPDQPL